MSNENELVSIQQELRLAKQESEIMRLKFQLEKSQAEKASRLEDSLFSPALFEHYQKVAEILSKSNVIPKDYKGKPEDIFVAIAMGYQLGFPVEQALQDIAVINGRPSVWGDGLLALALNSPECEFITEEPICEGTEIIGYECSVKRKGYPLHKKSFTLQNAKQAGLLGKPGPWTQYPTRMLQMRARQAIKDRFADKLRGLRVVEIDEYDESVIEGEFSNTTNNKQINGETQTERLKNLLGSNEIQPTPKYTTSTVYLSGKEIEDITIDMPIEADTNPISQDDINKIEILMEEKKFDDARRKRALDYFKVNNLSDLTESQAKIFFFQLGKT